MNYCELVTKVRKYHRLSLLCLISEVNAKLWTNQKIDISSNLGKAYLTHRAYGSRIAVISAATGNDHHHSYPSEKDMLNLSHFYLEIKERIADEGIIKKDFFTLIEAIGNTCLKDFSLDEGCLKICSVKIFFMRLLRSQYEHVTFKPTGIERSWAIFKEYIKKNNNAEYDKVRNYLKIDPLHVLRSGYGFIALSEDKKTQWGKINTNLSNIDIKVREVYQIDNDVLNLIAKRWSRTFAGFREWHDKVVLQEDEYFRKYVPSPLVQTPLIDLEGNHDYLLPSPWHLAWRMKDVLFESLQRIHENTTERELLNTSLGEALEDVLEDELIYYFGIDKVIRIDKIQSDNTRPKADFVLVDSGYAIIVEVKKSIGGVNSKVHAQIDDIVKMWDKLVVASKQCSGTLHSDYFQSIRNKYNIKKVVTLVCIGDDLVSESGIFLFFAYGCNLISQIDLQYHDIFSVDEFDELISSFTIPELTKAIIDRWNTYKTGSDIDAQSSMYYRNILRDKKSYSQESFYKNLAEEIMPIEE